MNFLKEVQVPETLTPEELQGAVEQMASINALTFTEADAPKGIDGSHIKALHITVFLKDHSIPKMLIDTGAALNICPLSTFHALGLKESLLTPSTASIRAYDNSKRTARAKRAYLGLIPFRRQGPLSLMTQFHVLDIKATFNLLLGRPWLHQARAISST